jgi:hypothetical protein
MKVAVTTAELARLRAVDERARWAARRSLQKNSPGSTAAVAAACSALAEWIHSGRGGRPPGHLT